MERSDRQQPPAADPAAPNSEAAKAPVPAEALPTTDAAAAIAEPLEHLTEAESDAIERAHFEMLEGETTQPVRPYAVTDDAGADDTPNAAFEAAPDTQSGASVETGETQDTEPEDGAPVTAASEEPPQATTSSSAMQLFLIPTPLAVPPTDSSSQPGELATQHRTSRTAWLASGSALPMAADEPLRQPRLPLPSQALPVAPASVTARLRLRPTTWRYDWRDIARRAANVAFLLFAGWFIAVLVLIAAYRFINPPFSMLMAQRFITGTAIDNDWVPIERISPNLSRAVIVAEDGRFCQHWGIDLVEAANAIRRASDGYPRGASTITMQVAKNLFLIPAKSYLRKIVEIPLTFAIELAWPKQRILEVYLNIVEWGPGIFGAEAASRAHFGRPASGLSPRQAAQLAAVLPNPLARDAGAPGPRTAHKASIIQARAARTREASACVDIRR